LKRPRARPDRIRQLFASGDTAESLDVLFGLLLDHVDDVVEGEHPDQPLVLVHHRGCHQIVALEHARHLLLVLGGAHAPAVGVHQLSDRHRPLGAQQPVEPNGAKQLGRLVDHIQFEEAIRQFHGLAHVVDGMADGPGRRHGDEFGLHAPAGRAFRIVQDALKRTAFGRRELFEDLVLFLLREILENIRGVVGIEIADALGDRLGRHLFEDFLTDRVVDLGERGEVELAAHQFDEAPSQLRVERLDQVAGVGLMQFAGQCPQAAGIVAVDRRSHAIDEISTDRALLVAERHGVCRRGHVFLVEHAGLAVASCAD
jgi:hypothetical protein